MAAPVSVVEGHLPARNVRRIGPLTLLRILWRTFFFQAATNFERMQNLGFAYCMLPALTRLYEGDALKRAMQRHLEFFNTHPYMADALIGASVRMEEEVAAGRRPPEQVVGFKRCMMGPMAAIGDSFFWASLKPFGAAWAIAGVLSGVHWAPLAFLFLYNLFHLTLRVYGLFAGYRMGERVFEKLNQLDLVRFADRSHYLAGAFLGVSAALLVDRASLAMPLGGAALESILLVALTVIFLLCLKRKLTMPLLLYGFSFACIGLVLLLNAWFPLL